MFNTSAHIHIIEDDNGDITDKQDNGDNYQGWNGLNEISSSQKCENITCNNQLAGVNED
jgi:hypothetical protein